MAVYWNHLGLPEMGSLTVPEREELWRRVLKRLPRWLKLDYISAIGVGAGGLCGFTGGLWAGMEGLQLILVGGLGAVVGGFVGEWIAAPFRNALARPYVRRELGIDCG